MRAVGVSRSAPVAPAPASSTPCATSRESSSSAAGQIEPVRLEHEAEERRRGVATGGVVVGAAEHHRELRVGLRPPRGGDERLLGGRELEAGRDPRERAVARRVRAAPAPDRSRRVRASAARRRPRRRARPRRRVRRRPASPTASAVVAGSSRARRSGSRGALRAARRSCDDHASRRSGDLPGAQHDICRDPTGSPAGSSRRPASASRTRPARAALRAGTPRRRAPRVPSAASPRRPSRAAPPDPARPGRRSGRCDRGRSGGRSPMP